MRLEDEGLQLIPACDGERVWALGRRRRPDLVINDVGMPRLEGVGLLHGLHGAERSRQTPVILMSAVAPAVNTEHRTLVPKPLDLDRLLSPIEWEVAPG